MGHTFAVLLLMVLFNLIENVYIPVVTGLWLGLSYLIANHACRLSARSWLGHFIFREFLFNAFSVAT
jgi:hypothetical protein